MKSSSISISVASIAALALTGCGDGGGEYPDSDIELVVPYGPGGATDPIGREFVTQLGQELDTGSRVENLPGGGESIGVSNVHGANPDGYRLGMASFSGLVIQPLINEGLEYEGVEDYTPIARMSDVPEGLYVAADSPYEDLDDFIAAAEENPGDITVASSGSMNESMFAMIALQQEADIELNLMATSGGAGEAATALISGEFDAISVMAPGQLGLVEGGELRQIGHSGDSAYSDYFPGTTAFEDAGYDIPFGANLILFGPPEMDDEVVDILRDAATSVAEGDEWNEWMDNNANIAAPVMMGDELEEWINQEESVYAEAVQQAEDTDIEEQ